ncbi:ChaB family protein [Lyngbya confervoides]|uniref:ChaB family protein n=1 Tax=Lyngbya confervoides BDU141951 TaxID=1574623 RepID=A0ABD4T064_9CYAN|nr:ChaB family protein [Lyngbya confervoides]MCM1981687.1 ChaB family protein [Lyngbya confervoides BDU141951]
MSTPYLAERTLSAIFKTQSEIDQVVRRLLERDVPRDHISVMGRNFETQTRISGFITKKDVILGGLRTGAVFGSLIGSFFSLLTGVGVLFIPFVGPVVAAGPLGALLLGAAGGAIAGSAGAGLVSVLTTLGMPEEKAAVYQTRLQAGEYIVMVEVPAAQSGEFHLLLESSGGEDIHESDKPLPHPCPGRCNGVDDLSPEVRNHLSEAAQQVFIHRYNAVYDETEDEMKAEQAAWRTVHEKFDEDENGIFSKLKELVS